MTPNLYTLVPELGTSDVRMTVNIPDQVNGTDHPRFSQWAFSNNIAESYNMAVNIAHNHTTRGGANGRTNREAQSAERGAEVSPSMMAHGLVQVAKQFQLSKYFFFQDIMVSEDIIVSDAKLIAAGRILRFFKASPVWLTRQILAEKWADFLEGLVWTKLTESRLRESQLREAVETLVQGSDRGRSRRKLADKASETVVGDRDREELQDKHMDTS
jgi:hypothetical protein